MSNKLLVWILVIIIYRCHGLGSSSIEFENDVGVIRLLQPTFTGRNVTFTFTPLKPTALDDIQWKYMNGSDENTIEQDNKQFIVYSDWNSSSLTILDADQSLNGIFFYTLFDGNNKSSMIDLTLKDYTVANGCGELYLLSEEPIFAGDNVSFGYYLSPEVAKEKNASKYSVELVIGSIEDHTFILQTYGVLELQQEGHEYIFTLFNVKNNTSGRYLVQCADGLAKKYSNSIDLSVEGMPVIGPLTNISTCRECIVFKAEQTLSQVNCNTDGEYNDANVTFKIGHVAYTLVHQSPTSFRLRSREKPSDDMHGLNAVCTVSGIHRNMSVEAPIYVVEIPEGPPHLSASRVLLEGEAVDITCTSSKARPPPLLKLYVEQSVIDTNISSAFDNKTGFYKSVLKLHTFQKEWGKKKMWCQQLPDADNLYTNIDMSNIIHVEYKYPPLRLNLDVIDLGNQSKEIAVHCSAFDSNPVCNITWESSIENFKYSFDEYASTRHTSISTIRFNVTDADFGKQIRCRTKCPDFNNTLSNATDVIFAKKPRVVISSTPVLPVPPNSRLALTCASNAFPYGNITWQLLKADNSLSSHEKVCLNASTCTYEITTSDVEQEYLCIAENKHGTHKESIPVTVRTNEHNEELTGKDSSSLVGGIMAVIAILCLGLVVLCFCRYKRQAKIKIGNNQTGMAKLPSPTAADTDDVTHEHIGGAEYAVINKTQRDPENVALITCDEAMPACEANNECLKNALTETSVHVEQQLIDFDDGVLEQGQSTQHDARTAANRDDVTHARMDGAEYAVIDKTHINPVHAAPPSRKDQSSIEAYNKGFDNASTESSVHVKQPSTENGVSAEEPGPSTKHDARTAADRDDVTHARVDGAEYAVIDKTHRDPKIVALPSSKDISSCKSDNERLDNAATESSVNLEQPSLANGKRALEPGPSRQPDVSGCHSKEDINTTENVKDIGVSKQKQITNPDAPNANSPKRATDELVYADVDIEHLEKSRAGNRTCNNDEPTEYSDIVFGASCSVQTDSSKEAVYNN